MNILELKRNALGRTYQISSQSSGGGSSDYTRDYDSGSIFTDGSNFGYGLDIGGGGSNFLQDTYPSEIPIEQTLTDAGLTSDFPASTELPIEENLPTSTEKSIEESLTDAGLVADLPANQVRALTKAGGLTSTQIDDILAKTNYSDSVKALIKSMQPDPNSTLGLLGFNPGISYDQLHETISPEQESARFEKIGELVESAANILISASPIGKVYNTTKTIANVLSGTQTAGEAITQIGMAALASKLGISSSVLTKAIDGDFGGAAQSFITGKLSSSISRATGLPGALVSTMLKDADINKGTANTKSVANGFSKTIDGILGTGKEPISNNKLQTIANFETNQIAALNPEMPEEEESPYFVQVTGGATKDVSPDFDVSKLPEGTELASQEDRDNGLASYDAASNAWVINAETMPIDETPITGDNGQNRITDSNLAVNPNIGTTDSNFVPATEGLGTPQELSPVTVVGGRETPITGDNGQNRITDSDLSVNPNVGTTDSSLAPVTVTGKRETPQEIIPVKQEEPQELAPVTVVGKREAPQELAPVTVVGKKEETPVTPAPITPAPVTPAQVTTTTPVKTATPAEQLYQTTTQSQPTTLADIKYYLDMTGTDILPPTTKHDPLESLLSQSSQPMSLDELLRHLRK